jgi:hypothetical protein
MIYVSAPARAQRDSGPGLIHNAHTEGATLMAGPFVRAEFEDGSVASVSAARAKSNKKLKTVPNSAHSKPYPADYSAVKTATKKQES